MDDYRIEPEGAGFRVVKTSSTGSVSLIGRFLSESNAQFWIDDQIKLTARRRQATAAIR